MADKICFGRTYWDWDLIFGLAVKAISSLGVCSPCLVLLEYFIWNCVFLTVQPHRRNISKVNELSLWAVWIDCNNRNHWSFMYIAYQQHKWQGFVLLRKKYKIIRWFARTNDLSTKYDIPCIFFHNILQNSLHKSLKLILSFFIYKFTKIGINSCKCPKLIRN